MQRRRSIHCSDGILGTRVFRHHLLKSIDIFTHAGYKGRIYAINDICFLIADEFWFMQWDEFRRLIEISDKIDNILMILAHLYIFPSRYLPVSLCTKPGIIL